MKMKELYDSRQERWKEFRDKEAQRRAKKAAEQEKERLAGVLASSRARKEQVLRKFAQTATVHRSHHAATTIQRAFRAMKSRNSWRERQRKREEKIRAEREEWAAGVIQRAWGGYRAHKEFRALNYRAVATCPVIGGSSLRHKEVEATGHSYERAISVTG